MQNDQNQPNQNPMPQDQPMNDDQGGMPTNPTPEPMPEGGEEEKHEDPSMPGQGGSQQM